MKWVVRLVSAVIALVVVAIAISFTLPAQSSHTRVIVLKQTPEAVFAVLSDVQKFPSWNRNLEKVETLPPIDGKDATKQTFRGGMTMTVVTTESLAPTHLVRTLRDVSGNTFSGSWNYEITPTNEGCEVALSEKANLKNRLSRLRVWLLGSTRYVDQHLVALAKHFDEKPIIRSQRSDLRR